MPDFSTLADDPLLAALASRRFGMLDQFDGERLKVFMKEHVVPGFLVVVVRTYGGVTEVSLDEVVGEQPAARRTRFYTANFAAHTSPPFPGARAAWYFTGQSADAPKGQVRAYPPLPELVDAALSRRMLIWGQATTLSGYWSPNPELVAAALAQTQRLFGVDLTPVDH